jgi:hypothetical protein
VEAGKKEGDFDRCVEGDEMKTIKVEEKFEYTTVLFFIVRRIF